MKCPHCTVTIHPDFRRSEVIDEGQYFRWSAESMTCPACNRPIIMLVKRDRNFDVVAEAHSGYPKSPARVALPKEVPPEFAQDFNEACLVLFDSPKASAALSRRCLQRLLRSRANVKPQDLNREIEEVLPQLPSHLADAVDAIRINGNFAAHPLKSTNTGEIVDVEPGEADWSIEVLEQLFDFYFVQPEKLKAKRDALNRKLQDAGKPPMK